MRKKFIKPLVKKGQTTNHLYINHPEVLNFSKVSFYNYINKEIFEFGPLDFPRIVKEENLTKEDYKERYEILKNTRLSSRHSARESNIYQSI